MKRKIGIILLFLLFGCQSEEVQLSEDDKFSQENSVVIEELNEPSKPFEEEVEEKKEKETENVVDSKEEYEIDPNSWRVVSKQESDKQIVLLTIDDAPEHYSVEMAEQLKELDAGAIFFVNGHFIQTEEGRDRLERIYELGFEIGNHTMNHPNMGQLSAEEQEKEIVELNDLIEEVIGIRPRFYRAPFGVNTIHSDKIIEKEDMIKMNWTYGYDWEPEYQDADELANIMVHTPLLSDGANLLMHDRKWTNEAIQQIVNGLREKGFVIIDPGHIVK